MLAVLTGHRVIGVAHDAIDRRLITTGTGLGGEYMAKCVKTQTLAPQPQRFQQFAEFMPK